MLPPQPILCHYTLDFAVKSIRSHFHVRFAKTLTFLLFIAYINDNEVSSAKICERQGIYANYSHTNHDSYPRRTVFRSWLFCGRSWYFHGDTPEKPVTWEDVVSFIKDNMVDLALEGFLDDERLADNA
jgi:hypothetical protein